MSRWSFFYNVFLLLFACLSATHSLASTHKTFRIVSWNILADVYARPEKYPKTLAVDLDWDARSSRIVNRLKEYNADVVCMQEVQLSSWQSFAAECQCLGYNCELIQNVTREHPVALAILYNPQVIQVLAVESRSRAILAAISIRPTNEIVFLANVHFQAGQDGRAEEQRYFQIRSLLRRIELYAEQFSGASPAEEQAPNIIIVGDFNMNRSSDVYHLLSTGDWPFNSCKPSVRLPFLPLKDVYCSDDAKAEGDSSSKQHRQLQMPTFRTGCVLDYIFVSWPVKTVLWHAPSHPASRRNNEKDTDRLDYLAWPNEEHPSDHWPIGVDISVMDQVVVDTHGEAARSRRDNPRAA
jgi:mRNA deadenylase 3'-5' endonuclease subunit Ccr4